MGKIFSDPVEQALRCIYYDMRAGRGQEGLQLLEQASAAGDGDASCILARCLLGNSYVWSGHRFPVDEKRATDLLRLSVSQGSALGVLISLRSGELPPQKEKGIPFSSLQEAFDLVLEKAKDGDAFCQYTIGNSYFWWDFLRIQGKTRESFSSQEEYKAYLRENISQCEDWFLRAFRGGMYLAAANLNRYYTKGDEDIIAPQPAKAEGLWRQGAELGYPVHQYFYAEELEKAGQNREAILWYQKAAEGGHLDGWYHVGKAYDEGKAVPRDYSRAAECYEKGLNSLGKKIGCSNCLGVLYFDGQGVPQDYKRAYELFKYCYDQGNTWSVFYLGKCCFYGLGTGRDYVKAREYLEKESQHRRESLYMLGVIYGQGLGVAEDIRKAVEYLQKAGDMPDAKAELLRYKKTIWGKWVRR